MAFNIVNSLNLKVWVINLDKSKPLGNIKNNLVSAMILTNNFGGSRFIVDEIVLDICNMKTVNKDKKFIKFVVVIDKIHRDLVELNLESEIATTNMVKEIERKLPNLIRRDWSNEFMA